MSKLTVPITVFLVGLLAGSASAMVVHWTELIPYREVVAWPGIQENPISPTFDNMFVPDGMGAFQIGDRHDPSFTSGLYRGNDWFGGAVTDFNNEYIVGRLGDAHDTKPSAIPEPGTMMLLGIGMAGTSLAARRRRKGQLSSRFPEQSG